MHSFGKAFYDLKNELLSLYDEQEAAAIAHELLYHITGMEKMGRLMQKEVLFTDAQQEQYDKGKDELLSGKPLQYVTGIAWFMGKAFRVNEQVLIPRPETEELVDWIVKEYKGKENISILDIGTGSGCIPISLQLALPKSITSSCDISKGAISVARENARILNADVPFIETDFLNKENWKDLGEYDIIVSNPPYIPQKEYANMHTNVRDHEPSVALFVPDDDALLFYRNIGVFGETHLKPGGGIYCELHKDHAEETERMFQDMGYEAEVRKDMNGNERMIKLNRDY